MAKKKKRSFGLFINGRLDYTLIIITALLLSIGLITLLSASAPTSLSETGDNSYKYVSKQGLMAIAGVALMIFLSKIDYRIYRRLKWPIYAVFIALLVLVGVKGLGEGGAVRWISIAGFSFQPSEFAKVGFVIVFASFLSDVKESNKIKKFWKGFVFPLALLGPIVFSIYILQNHFSATFIIASILVVQMFVAGTSLKWFFGTACLGAAGISAIIVKILSAPAGEAGNFRFSRIQTWLDLESADLTKEAWQITNSLYAIGSGGLFGLGLGNSRQKYLYLPEPQNDFIFAVLAEELGFFGCVSVILLFMLFIWRGIVISMKAEDNFGTLIGIGLTTMIGLQALINIAVVTNTMPVTGMPLPFFSYGGSAMIANLAAVGILLSISRNGKTKKE